MGSFGSTRSVCDRLFYDGGIMTDEQSFDQGYLFGLLALDKWIRENLSSNTTVNRIRTELVALLNDRAYGTFTQEVDDARSNRCE